MSEQKEPRLASGNQLWVLHRSGRLQYVATGGAKPLTSSEASAAIQLAMKEDADLDEAGSAEKLVSA